MGGTNAATISVAIVTHGRPELLDACLRSCVSQDWDALDIVVVLNPPDNRSSSLAANHAVRAINTHKNIGFFPALNLAIANCRGNYIMVMDDDAKFMSNDCLARLKKILDEDDRCMIATCNIQGPCEAPPRTATAQVHLFKTGFALFRRRVFDDVAGFVPDAFFRAGGETFLSNCIYDHGFKVVLCHEAWMFHAQSAIARNNWAMNHYAVRNHALIVVLQEPLWVVLPSLLAKLVSTFIQIAIRRGDPLAWFSGWIGFLSKLPWAISRRKPIRSATYLYLRNLRSQDASRPVVHQSGDELRPDSV
ncbi:MAG: glycosyltransferase [Hyphomicrobiaceae bacterium]|nr:glycosyltransferase [Hyphomicrobiaceae bacterium]